MNAPLEPHKDVKTDPATRAFALVNAANLARYVATVLRGEGLPKLSAMADVLAGAIHEAHAAEAVAAARKEGA